jgi:flagellar capping protein FliD
MKYYVMTFLIVVCFFDPYVFAENKTINERLIRVEASVTNLDKRIDGTNKKIDETNKKIDETNAKIELLRQDMNKQNDLLRQDMNNRFEQAERNIDKRFEAVDKRFESLDKRLDDNVALMHTIFNALIGIIGLICALIAFIIYDRVRASKL